MGNLYEFFESPWAYVMLVNAILGLALFELAYARFKRFPDMNTKYAHVTERFPAMKRLDSHGWARWKFWPGAMTIFIPRAIIIISLNFLLWPISSIILIKQPVDAPILGCRRSCLRFWYMLSARL